MEEQVENTEELRTPPKISTTTPTAAIELVVPNMCFLTFCRFGESNAQYTLQRTRKGTRSPLMCFTKFVVFRAVYHTACLPWFPIGGEQETDPCSRSGCRTPCAPPAEAC